MNEVVYRIIAIAGLILTILGNYFSLKARTRKKFTYLFFTIGATTLLIYSISIGDVIFIVLQSAVIITSIYEYYLVHIKKAKSPKIK